jgi:hypothetical protein
MITIPPTPCLITSSSGTCEINLAQGLIIGASAALLLGAIIFVGTGGQTPPIVIENIYL